MDVKAELARIEQVHEQGRNDEALATIEGLAKQLGGVDPALRAQVKRQWGDLLRHAKRHEESLRVLEEALKDAALGDDAVERRRLHLDRVTTLAAARKGNDARTSAQELVEKYKAAGQFDRACAVHVALSIGFAETDLLLESIQVGDHGLLMAREHGLHRVRGVLANNNVWTALDAGAPDKALAYAREALEAYKAHGQQPFLERAHYNLADVHKRRGETADADREFAECLRQTRELKDPYEIAMAALALGELRKSKELLNEARAAFASLGDAGRVKHIDALLQQAR